MLFWLDMRGGDGVVGGAVIRVDSASAFVYNVSVDQNMRMLTHVHDDAVVTPCL